MNENKAGQVIPVNPDFAKKAWINKEKYLADYKESIENPDAFWGDWSRENIDWIEDFTKVKNTSFDGDVSIKWFEDGKLNISANCVDRHVAKRGDKTAIIAEGDDPTKSEEITYNQLLEKVSKLANTLKDLGVKKGDRVMIYMPMIAEAAYAMLACARIGAVHSVVFGGFSASALRGRVEDCKSVAIITADESVRGGRVTPLKHNVDEALEGCELPQKVLVVKRTGAVINWDETRDYCYDKLMKEASDNCPPEPMNAEDPLFILYTSGSTGKPKGVLHTSGGYITYAACTHKYIFDYHEDDIYWCTADVGWVTGHSYVVYGPLANGATTLMFEGLPNYPDSGRCWDIVDKHNVSIFYTAPTAIRALMCEGDDWVKKHSRESLRVLGTVGEPINPEVWRWYYDVVGDSRCPVVDTWWQTETGGIMITPLAGATDLKPGSATLPFFGANVQILDEKGDVLEGEAEGRLCIADSWPGQMRTVFGDHKRFVDTYFADFKGKYFTGDSAKRDKDGYYWITGRIDDVLNISGHRLGTAEIESALVLHEDVAEAAVVGYPHDIKGEGIYAYIMLNSGIKESENLKEELVKLVRKEIGGIAKPDFLHVASSLPKTRSGKIMRRILRKIAHNDYGNLGDVNTLLNPEIVDELIEGRLNR